MEDTEYTYIPMATGVQFCYICPHAKIGYRRPIVLCTTFSGEGRCEEHRNVPDTEADPAAWEIAYTVDRGAGSQIPWHLVREIADWRIRNRDTADRLTHDWATSLVAPV